MRSVSLDSVLLKTVFHDIPDGYESVCGGDHIKSCLNQLMAKHGKTSFCYGPLRCPFINLLFFDLTFFN